LTYDDAKYDDGFIDSPDSYAAARNDSVRRTQ
jgi:hypothetical protein